MHPQNVSDRFRHAAPAPDVMQHYRDPDFLTQQFSDPNYDRHERNRQERAQGMPTSDEIFMRSVQIPEGN